MANETPIFMAECIKGARKDQTLGAVMLNTSDALKLPKPSKTELSLPSTTQVARMVCGRPKTPTLTDLIRQRTSSIWLARYFNAVWLAICDGKTDSECLAVWRGTDRVDILTLKRMKTLKAPRARSTRKYGDYKVGTRAQDTSHAWHVVK